MASQIALTLSSLKPRTSYLGEYVSKTDQAGKHIVWVPARDGKPIVSRTGAVYKRLPSGSIVRISKKK